MTREAGVRDPTRKRNLRRPEVEVGNATPMAYASAFTVSARVICFRYAGVNRAYDRS